MVEELEADSVLLFACLPALHAFLAREGGPRSAKPCREGGDSLLLRLLLRPIPSPMTSPKSLFTSPGPGGKQRKGGQQRREGGRSRQCTAPSLPTPSWIHATLCTLNPNKRRGKEEEKEVEDCTALHGCSISPEVAHMGDQDGGPQPFRTSLKGDRDP